MRKMMMLVRQRRTVEFVTCTSVTVVYTPYTAPSTKRMSAIGAKIFIGLNSVIIRRMIRTNRAPFWSNF